MTAALLADLTVIVVIFAVVGLSWAVGFAVGRTSARSV